MGEWMPVVIDFTTAHNRHDEKKQPAGVDRGGLGMSSDDAPVQQGAHLET